MIDPTSQKVLKYNCGECEKLYKRKGSLTNHLKKVHNKDNLSATEEFLDATSYSEELDMEETVLRNIDRDDVAHNFFGDISDNESDDGNTIVQAPRIQNPSFPTKMLPLRQSLSATQLTPILKIEEILYQPPFWPPSFQPPPSWRTLTRAFRSRMMNWKSKLIAYWRPSKTR